MSPSLQYYRNHPDDISPRHVVVIFNVNTFAHETWIGVTICRKTTMDCWSPLRRHSQNASILISQFTKYTWLGSKFKPIRDREIFFLAPDWFKNCAQSRVLGKLRNQKCRILRIFISWAQGWPVFCRDKIRLWANWSVEWTEWRLEQFLLLYKNYR